jgi:tRNA dimethylallyltransferase
MFAQGLVEETRKLLESGLRNNRNAMQALGYRQVIEHLCGERSLTDTIALVKTRTRRYAKKQMTWFRGQLSLRWLEVGSHEVPEQTVERLLELPGSAADRC